MKIHLSVLSLLFLITALAYGTTINVPDNYPTIQSGINASINGDTVLVQPGTYIENINFNGRNIVLGSLFLIAGDTAYISQTVIDGNQSGPVVTFESWEGTTTLLTGFTITNGSSNHGGGIWCYFSNPVIRYNIITGNQALQGGGIKCSASNVQVEHNLFSWNSNWAGQISAGGGIYVYQSNAMIAHNTFIHNHSERHGGAIHIEESTSLITNNIISNNTCGEIGGGITCYVASFGHIVNNLIINNSAQLGGGIFLGEAFFTIANNTICSNTADHGGGIDCWNDAEMLLVNTILWDNTADISGSQIYFFYSHADIHHCNIKDGESGFFVGNNATYTYENNIDSDPLFQGNGEHPFSLLNGSECINTGTPDTSGLALPVYDLAGNLRIAEDQIDIGAYEWPEIVSIFGAEQLSCNDLSIQIFPNPFKTNTSISYNLPVRSEVIVSIFDALGQKIKQMVNGNQNSGKNSIAWDGTDNTGKRMKPGTYIVQIQAGEYFQTKRIVLVK